jgi:hypothetical protein
MSNEQLDLCSEEGIDVDFFQVLQPEAKCMQSGSRKGTGIKFISGRGAV